MSIQITVQAVMHTTLMAGVFIIGPALHDELHHILLTYAHYITLLSSLVKSRFILLRPTQFVMKHQGFAL